MTPEVACQEVNKFCSSLVDGQATLKKSHNYYYQIQGQLGVTQLPWCDFVIWTPHGASVQRVERDEISGNRSIPNLRLFTMNIYSQNSLIQFFTVASRSDAFNSLRSRRQL